MRLLRTIRISARPDGFSLMLTTGRGAQTPGQLPRVLHVSRPAAGGLRQHLVTLLRGLGQRGCECALAGPAALLRDIEETKGGAPCESVLPIEITDRPQLQSDLLAARRLRRAAAGFDLVHAHGMRAAWIAAVSGCRPFVLTAHNLYRRPGGMLAARAGSFALGRASLIIAVSEAVGRTLEEAGVSSHFIRVVPNGIAPPRPRATRDEIRERHGIGPDAPLVLCVARLMADKGVDVLVQAWSAIQQASPSARCIIAGDGPDMPALREMSARLHGLALAGFVDDAASLYAAADVVAIPSRREGQSLVCLEAMASQPAPAVVASDAGGLPEMVRDGVTGLLVAKEDPGALADAVVRLLGDAGLRRALSEAAAVMVAERYSTDAMCDATTRVYSQTLRAKKPGS